MNVYYVRNRHLVVPLTDEEYLELKVRAARADLKIKDWVGRVIRAELEKEIGYHGNDGYRYTKVAR